MLSHPNESDSAKWSLIRVHCWGAGKASRDGAGRGTAASESKAQPAVVAVRFEALTTTLLVTSAILVFASAAVQFAANVLDHGNLLGLTHLLDMQAEANIP